MLECIRKLQLPERTKEKASSIILRLKNIEEKIHFESGHTIFHGDLESYDTLFDVLLSTYAIDCLKPKRIISSPINLGGGFIEFNGKKFTVPMPAVSLLAKDMVVYTEYLTNRELTTPTGIAIVKEFVDEFGSMPVSKVYKVGFGAGDYVFDDIPNILRVFEIEINESIKEEDLILVQTNVDDTPPNVIAYTCECLFSAGANDVWTESIYMKKSRMGIKICALIRQDILLDILKIIFKQTTTLGVRVIPLKRYVLDRKEKEIETELGKVRVKEIEDKIIPEFEDCKKIAQQKDMPLLKVYKQIK